MMLRCIFKTGLKLSIFLGFLVLCLESSVTFVDPVAWDDSYRIVIEFRNIDDSQATLGLPPVESTQHYKPMYALKEVYAAPQTDEFWVARGSEVRAVKSDIYEVYAQQTTHGAWTVFIVFQKDFSRKLVHLSDRNIGQSIAVVINGELLSVPVFDNSLAYRLDSRGRYSLAIPTRMTSVDEIEGFLNQFHLLEV